MTHGVPDGPSATEVAIVGGGPVGVLIANLLGVYGIRTDVYERSPEILDYPRAVGMDDEALRVLQAAGLADDVLRDTISNVPMRMFTANGHCFADILPSTREFGWYRRNIFSQPLAERALRRGLQRFGHVRLHLGHEVLGLTQSAEGVRLRVRDSAGQARDVHARYAIGCDGGRSAMRDKFLQIPFDGTTHPRKWVVIECSNDPLDAPYTALHCTPARPYVSLRLPYRVRRWEFILFPGEDDEQMLRPEMVRALLRPHVPDPDALDLIRARVYTHHSRVARRFRDGRVFLAGDAAHLSPPWIGQGLNAGIRDAGNLAWKIAGAVRGTLSDAMLDSYQAERHAHARAMIALADQVGAVFALRNRVLAWLRDRLLLAMQHLPPVRDYVLQMRFKPMPRHGAGGIVVANPGAPGAAVGRMFPQPLVEDARGAACRLDDVLGPGFAILGWGIDPLDCLPQDLQRAWQAMVCTSLMVVRARSGDGPGQLPRAGAATRVVQDVENLLAPWFLRNQAQWVVLRPDRHVALACTGADAPQQARALLQLMGMSLHTPHTATGATATSTP